jgi:CRISPR-associated endonuclease/helicase Cas3
MERAAGKAERLLQIEALLLEYPDGLSQAEIARRIGVNRSTVYRYLPDLGRFCVYETDDERLTIDRDHYLTNVRLTLHESMALHLAARLMATRTDKHNPHAAAALRKLGLALEKLAPRVAQHLKASAEVMEDQAQRHDPVYLKVLETLTRAWSDGRVAHLWHRMEDGRVFDYDFAPYFIEPYAVGQTTHVIGWREPPGALRTFKLERIQRIELTDRTYTIPADFDPRQLLADAWGIWYTEAEPVQVVLKFHPRVAHRVRETQWHRSEEVEDQPDGSLIWRARVAEVQEMVPWIRGWGADVEVVAPKRLREMLVGETQRLALLYGVGEVAPPPLYQLLWAKTDKSKTITHPLICHLIDVAQVTLALWNTVLTGSIRTQFADALGLDVEAGGRLIAFLAGLHDLGKASPCFQRKHAPTQVSLAKAGLSFPKVFSREPCPHGTISADALETLLETETGLHRRLAKKIARAMGGHHGAWPSPHNIQHLKSTQVGGEDWDPVRHDLLHAMVMLFEPPPVERLGATRQEENALLTLLSGLTSTADWIGSMERYFPYAVEPIDPVRYAERAAAQARRALEELGWIGWQPPTEGVPFRDLFRLEPRPMQEAVVNLAERLSQPALVIIEAPTGIGKTEAALYLADHWARTCQQRGLYVAMPTMATSNQMFSRVQELLARRYPESLVNVHLIHSQARWREDMQALRLETFDEGQGGTVAAMAWFLPHKRSLLAPFGVGTVDQALLSVLQARHFFVRLFGLSHKTVIFDEVHAYDTYMSAIFQRLLGWLRAVGASVVLLSATLPAQTRRELLQAYAGMLDVSLPDVCYPAITWTMGDQIGVVPLEAPPSRIVTLEWIGREPETVAERLTSELRSGGCAAVICNTVKRAQEVYKTLKEADIVPEQDLILFHARFPFAWRDEIEQKVLFHFGKENDRPHKAIVVATQVIEQSLDLDFDLMITDLAPVDLILQRAGRLHRHQRDGRPVPLSTPRLLVTTPAHRDGAPDFGHDVYVYERYVLLRSYLALQGRDQVTLPVETEALIEAVYGDEEPPADSLTKALGAALMDARQRMQRHEEQHVYKARMKMIPSPQADDLLAQCSLALEEDSPELHEAFQALTRLIPPGVSLVCLHQTPAGLTLEPNGSGPGIDLAQEPEPDLTEQLARYTLKVTHQPVVQYFLAQSVPTGWRDHPLLRNHRAVIFTDGVCPLAGTPYTLRLSRKLGLEIEKEAE